MLHARGQSTAVLQQQHVDRLHRHTIHTTSAGMVHANGPTARATLTSTSWWWGQEQRMGLNFVDADTTQKATGATSAQIDVVCVICTSNSSTAAVASLFPPLSLSVSLFKDTSHKNIAISPPRSCPFIFSQLQRKVFVQTAFIIPYYLSKDDIDFVCVLCVFSSHSFWTSSLLDVPAGITQEVDHTGFFIHLLSAVRALLFLARRIHPFLSLVDREVEFCVLTI